MTLFTCQICGRDIQAKTGVIAHHGYKRPHRGSGWQTSSCFGARYRPYEVACDRLPDAIENIMCWLIGQAENLEERMTKPPATLTWTRGGFNKITTEVPRPADFKIDGHPSYRPGAYDTLFRDIQYSLEAQIANAQSDLAFMKKRLADWPTYVATLKKQENAA